jgi:hypothetical protein
MNKAVYLGGLVTWLSLAGFAASGCGRAVEYCDVKCECELCSDRKYDDCVISTDGDIDRAEAYECGEEHDALVQCAIDKADCDHNDFRVEGDDCDDESEDYQECVNDATDLGGGTGPQVCFCTCTCENGVTGLTCNGNGCCGGQCEAQCQNDAMGAAVSTDETCGSTQG